MLQRVKKYKVLQIMATFSDQSIGPSDFICTEGIFFLFGQVGPKFTHTVEFVQ